MTTPPPNTRQARRVHRRQMTFLTALVITVAGGLLLVGVALARLSRSLGLTVDGGGW